MSNTDGPDWQLTIKEISPDPLSSEMALKALFKIMDRELPKIAERMGVPLHQSPPIDPEEYARRHAEIKQFVLNNPWDCPVPGSRLTREDFWSD